MDIISVANVDIRGVGRKSVAMEEDAFIRTLDKLTQEVNVTELAALMRKN